MIRNVKIIWKNYMEMAEYADSVKTDRRFRSFHGRELETLKRCYPELILNDDGFTDLDEQITSSVQTLFPGAELQVEIIYPFDNESVEEECLVWTLSELRMSNDAFRSAVRRLTEAFPGVDFKIIPGKAKRPRVVMFAKEGKLQIFARKSSSRGKRVGKRLRCHIAKVKQGGDSLKS